MPTFYALAADAVVAVHVAYVAFVVLGLLLTLLGVARGWRWVRNGWFRGAHLATIGIVVAEAWLGITCPLTTWENQLRRLAGEATYSGDFVGRWLHEVMYFDLPPWIFTLIYTAFGLAVAATWVWAPPRRRNRITSPTGR
ncbi:MAG: DUF2784 domain-containing protein [Planctomycetaceae bacterium]